MMGGFLFYVCDINLSTISRHIAATEFFLSINSSAPPLMLSLTIRLYHRYHTLDIDRITLEVKKGGF